MKLKPVSQRVSKPQRCASANKSVPSAVVIIPAREKEEEKGGGGEEKETHMHTGPNTANGVRSPSLPADST